jgi:hypothetical protein
MRRPSDPVAVTAVGEPLGAAGDALVDPSEAELSRANAPA